jgi:hypothetical protein
MSTMKKQTKVLLACGAAVISFGIAIVACGGAPASSPGTGQCNNQINMSNAVQELRQARASLDVAEHNKGGWRVAAINATNEAISETERGCAVANSH